MNTAVCRAFTLYHDKLLINYDKNKILDYTEKPYLVVGYFDWFDTKIIHQFEHDENKDLKDLYEHSIYLNSNSSELQSFQNIFGFSSECEIDRDFWKKNDNKNLLKFVSFIQLDKYCEKCYKYINEIIGSNLSKNDYIIYYTLDKNDFVICFKSNNYKSIMNIINRLYNQLNKKGIEIIYSFTNMIIEKEELDDSSKLNKLNETIDSICIKTTINQYNKTPSSIIQKIDFFCDKLSEAFYGKTSKSKRISKDIVGYEILGDTDCRFIARDVPLKCILELFANNGLFSRNNSLYYYCFISSMTSLNIKVDHKIKPNLEVVDKSAKSYASFELVKKEELEEIKNGLESPFKPMVTLLNQIFSYITFTGYQTSQYEFQTLKFPFETIVRLIGKNKELINSEQLSIWELYDYMNNIHTNIQEDMRTDIRFFGISDFSLMSYYAPSKLRAFYSLFVNKISKFFSDMCSKDKETRYDFVIFFTYTPHTVVEQLWKDRIGEDKLMMVKVSEKDFYDVRYIMFQLAHEAAHFVGHEEIRHRKERFYYILEYMLETIYEYLNKKIRTELQYSRIETDSLINLYETQNLSFKELYAKVLDRIKDSVEKFIKEIEIGDDFYYLQNITKYISYLLYYKELAFHVFGYYFLSLIKNITAELALSKEYKKYSVDKTFRIIDIFETVYKHMVDYITEFRQELIDDDNSNYNAIKSFMYESYADISAVFLLNLSVDKYFDIIFHYIDNNPSEYVDSILFLRGCIVLKVLAELNEEKGEKELIESSYGNFFSRDEKTWPLGKENYNNIKKACKGIEKDINHPAYYAYRYVKMCIDSQIDNHNPDTRSNIKLIYNSVCNKSIIESVQNINKTVADINSFLRA